MPVSSIGEAASSEDVLIVDLLHVQTTEVDRFKVFLLVLGVPLTSRTGNPSIEEAIRNSVASWPVVWMGVEG